MWLLFWNDMKLMLEELEFTKRDSLRWRKEKRRMEEFRVLHQGWGEHLPKEDKEGSSFWNRGGIREVFWSRRDWEIGWINW